MKPEFEGCSKKIEARRIHEWVDGKFIVLGATSVNGKTVENAFFAPDYGDEYCQYAVLDTVAKTITYKRLEQNLEWIRLCDDVRTLKNKIYCLRTIVHTDQIGHLIVDNEDQGLLEINAAIGPFWGDMLELGNNLCELSVDDGLNCLPVRWLGGVEIENAKFVNEKGGTIYLRN